MWLRRWPGLDQHRVPEGVIQGSAEVGQDVTEKDAPPLRIRAQDAEAPVHAQQRVAPVASVVHALVLVGGQRVELPHLAGQDLLVLDASSPLDPRGSEQHQLNLRAVGERPRCLPGPVVWRLGPGRGLVRAGPRMTARRGRRGSVRRRRRSVHQRTALSAECPCREPRHSDRNPRDAARRRGADPSFAFNCGLPGTYGALPHRTGCRAVAPVESSPVCCQEGDDSTHSAARHRGTSRAPPPLRLVNGQPARTGGCAGTRPTSTNGRHSGQAF
jgi:hypothetical protein